MEKIKNYFWMEINTLKFSFLSKQGEILFLVIIYLVLSTFSKLPYINLVINRESIFVILSILTIFLFKLGNKSFLLLSIFCLVLSLQFLLIGAQKTAEGFSDLTYFYFVLWLLQELWQDRLFLKPKRDK